MGRRKRSLHVAARRVRPRCADVFQNARLEQVRILEHKSHLVHQYMRIGLPHVHAADFDASRSNVPEAGNQAGCRRLAAAGRADQSDGLPRIHPERYVVQRGNVRSVVGKADVSKRYAVVLGRLRVIRNRKLRCIHHLRNTRKRRAGQHHAACGKHDLRQRCGDDRGKDRIKSEVCDEFSEMSRFQRAGSQKQRRRHQKDERPFRSCQVDRLRQTADLARIMLRLGAVILDRFLERPERIHGLLEDLHDWNAAHVFGTRLAHHVLGRLVFQHQLCVLAAHHREHGCDRDHSCQHTSRAHAPVENEHQDDHRDHHGSASHNVRQIVREKCFRF